MLITAGTLVTAATTPQWNPTGRLTLGVEAPTVTVKAFGAAKTDKKG